ncbi:MAG: non-heme iron oxygenase ferredoxin subunit [Gemmatimonadota bacterium]|nr:non-heme iron oxygenase ferredoxin subunit [Gemmatimonadota bacterium]MDH3421536.1 non-heme iron oxygenase ferredoxin subunit [Gemmatimonadota bacterium]
MSRWTRVAALADCPVGEIKGVTAEDTAVVLANVDGTVYALRDQCSHEEYPLSDGELDGQDVVCVYHGARFDACSGARKALPAVMPVKSYPVEVRDGDIYIDVG